MKEGKHKINVRFFGGSLNGQWQWVDYDQAIVEVIGRKGDSGRVFFEKCEPDPMSSSTITYLYVKNYYRIGRTPRVYSYFELKDGGTPVDFLIEDNIKHAFDFVFGDNSRLLD